MSNDPDHPTAEWTKQQFREFLDGEFGHRYLIHDRDSVFSVEVDAALKGFGASVLKRFSVGIGPKYECTQALKRG
jgi:putative transposase